MAYFDPGTEWMADTDGGKVVVRFNPAITFLTWRTTLEILDDWEHELEHYWRFRKRATQLRADLEFFLKKAYQHRQNPKHGVLAYMDWFTYDSWKDVWEYHKSLPDSSKEVIARDFKRMQRAKPKVNRPEPHALRYWAEYNRTHNPLSRYVDPAVYGADISKTFNRAWWVKKMGMGAKVSVQGPVEYTVHSKKNWGEDVGAPGSMFVYVDQFLRDIHMVYVDQQGRHYWVLVA
ncbi:MAG: hypothetical protein L0215_19105 [Gemmataceae bacterium]|nr:hypothetical protein [Gemmataceae bacterium]